MYCSETIYCHLQKVLIITQSLLNEPEAIEERVHKLQQLKTVLEKYVRFTPYTWTFQTQCHILHLHVSYKHINTGLDISLVLLEKYNWGLSTVGQLNLWSLPVSCNNFCILCINKGAFSCGLWSLARADPQNMLDTVHWHGLYRDYGFGELAPRKPHPQLGGEGEGWGH